MEGSVQVPVVTYVLKLENDKFYVGKSWNLNMRLGQHFTGKGSKWTKLHSPLELLEVVLGDVERETTLKYMETTGWVNVRGAGWCQVKLYRNPLNPITDSYLLNF